MHLKPIFRLMLVCCVWLCASQASLLHAATQSPEAVSALLNRIGGEGTADRFVTVLDASLATSAGNDQFVITSANGKPCIKGSSTLAITTGLNWYLNHVAHINLTWNNLTTDLTQATLPLPAGEEKHTCSVPYRYYLNYCTFSYSMSTWTWDRWQKEIDWMALHGINMPLQIVGLDVLWHNLLTKDLGYSEAEANKFIAGPCFQAWWGMNNLQGWGGPNPSWWYARQEQLCKQILTRQRELGMDPVLPGYSGMVPSDIASKKGYTANNQGNWCTFVRPYILDPNSTAFAEISVLYYKRLAELMGTSTYYSMDPFHEGANTSGIDVPSAYKKIADAMLQANSKGKWVIQFWQWSGDQYNVLSKVQKGKLIVLDLYSDAHTHFGDYNGHDAIYCMLPNFGGRTGLFGRLSKVMEQFHAEKAAHSNVKGIGATPEAIEQVPVLYDALFELPWRATAPNAKQWVADYAENRYGKKNEHAAQAWELLRNSALACPSSLQGPQEAVLCARPALTVNAVSSWGGTELFYEPQEVLEAAFQLLEARQELNGENYSYDLTDVSRQALTDYAYQLLKAINSAHSSSSKEAYANGRDAFLQLLLDLDELLGTNRNFMLGRWTNMARGIADEASGTTESDRQWLELDNARTLITTWGGRDASENGGLRDYSYREWNGMLKDFYYDRWKTFFTNLDAGKAQPDWFDHDWKWAHNAVLSYSDTPKGNTAEVAQRLLNTYFTTFALADGTVKRINRRFTTDATSKLTDACFRGKAYALPLKNVTAQEVKAFCIDFNGDGAFSKDETFAAISVNIPAQSAIGRVKAQISLTDGTLLTYSIVLKDNITQPRTVSVSTAQANEGKAVIVGSKEQSVSTTDDVTVKAEPASGYDFYKWTDETGQTVSTENPYTYYGAADINLQAHFMINKWGSPKEDASELSTIESYGQYITSLTAAQSGRDAQSIYETASCPERLFQNTQIVEAAQGSQITLHWTSAGGLNYCRLSAYADLNSDGDFNDEGELLTVIGQKESAGNSKLNDCTIQVLLPYDIPTGLTHIRLRFDGAWAQGVDSKTNAMPADASTQRMIYEIPVNVLSQANYPCTVTVKSADTKKGTVDANGQPDTYTYGIGEEVVLRAYPADGCVVKAWQDQYGRTVPDAWRDGHFLRFRAPESGTYTAVFGTELPATLTLGNWEFSYTAKNDEITLVKALKGEGELDIPAKVNEYTITGMAADALVGQTALTSLSLPATLVNLGDAPLFTTQVKGDGTQDAPIELPQVLKANESWNVSLRVSTNGNSFNQWGSALLATGEESLGATYTNGFQLYLKADGHLLLKMGSDELKSFSLPSGATQFEVTLAHSSEQPLSMSVTAGEETTMYEAQGHALGDISRFCTALPEGINIESLLITTAGHSEAPFRGCTNLATVKVASGNKQFRATNNVLYSADGSKLLAYPEGRLSHRLALTSNLRTIGTQAFTQAPNLERLVLPTTGNEVNAETDAFSSVRCHIQTTAGKAAHYREAWGLPIVVNVTSTSSLSDASCALLTAQDAVDFSATDSQCGTATALSTDIPVWLTRTLKAGHFYALYFPTSPTGVYVEGLKSSETALSDLHAFTFDGQAFTPTQALGVGAYLVQIPDTWDGKRITFHFSHAEKASLPDATFTGNGSTAEVGYTGMYYAYDAATNRFVRQSATTLSLLPFTALLKANDSMPESIACPDLVSGIHQAVSGSTKSVYYDTNGRRATSSSKGVIIRNDGHKTLNR